MKLAKHLAIACLFAAAGTSVAYADDCSGRDHTAGTVLGAAGGAAIGGVASHNAGGAIAGAVVGGLAGNAIARAQDCDRVQYRRDQQNGRVQGGYRHGYVVAPNEEQYWGVDSYADFSSDYRRIQDSIRRASERGALTPYQAQRFSRDLQRIQYRANRDQREGRFNPRETENRLRMLREEMRSVRQDNREDRDSSYRR
jgi:hypothetical protein